MDMLGFALDALHQNKFARCPMERRNRLRRHGALIAEQRHVRRVGLGPAREAASAHRLMQRALKAFDARNTVIAAQHKLALAPAAAKAFDAIECNRNR
jgi:hypothetical protein